ncbi:F5/8 type C domain-containing protein [Sanguibacter gelidistatuariae]|uniref:F5/8 type C domain-containing protein n=1 Tax=Sanguibacter gelidistatuariae TaxID=1814289 RepID=A0A1G6KW93_9MICO|nr:discoidin domain-containing protein [Sanguibacter gelidistatuariae]SDC34666.1 F5/8 type C domain-containing protein [Sanguibacter gelidistatuariae]
MHTRSRTRYRWAALALALAVSATMAPLSPATAAPATLLSQDKVVTASSTENPDYLGARAAFDGNTATRWASAATDLQWIQVDLGESSQLSEIVLTWEAAYGKAFTVQASEDGATWTTLATVTNGTGGEQTLGVDGHGRYVRLALTARGTGYGYSLWEVQVFGTAGGQPVDPDPPVTPGQCGTANAALGKVATASSTENSGTPASSAVDANAATRWSSQFSDGQWWQVDLGAPTAICGVDLTWEASYGKDFRVQTSLDGVTWTTATTVTDGTGGKQSLDVAATGRYVRLDLTRRANGYGYSLWEVAVRTGDGTPTGPQLPGGGDLGPNVHVFTPSTPTATIQASLDEAFTAQEENQFGPRRDQFLFAPGTYDVNANIGFNTSISGLGRNPDDVTIRGGIWVDAGWFDGNATQNFWRSAENMAIEPLGGEARWAVSQAAPFRRMHVKGSLNLAPSSYGWASGGFIADSVVDGTVGSYSQQQWFTRDSTLGKWEGSVWNMVFSGVNGSPVPNFPNPSHTVLPTTPVIAEKPYLYLDGSNYAVFVPSVRTNARGTTWAGGSTPGTSIPISQFYVAKPGVTGDTINQALAQGLNLLFTPGVYHLDKTINVTRANTVVLGLGYATIVPEGGVTAMKVADVGGVKIAALLFDAGTTKSPFLLQVGTPGSHISHAANPTSIHDVFARVGGAVAGKVDTAIQINSDDTIVDHIWSWRGDHGAGIGWDVNTSDYGFVVNGDRVSAYGLFVEHFQKYNTLWNGNGGRTVFYQNELPYDVPSQAAYQNGSTRGYAAYKVADTVTSHEAWGLGAYTYFSTDPTIVLDNGFEVPITPGVRMHNLLTVSLGGNGTVQHVINGTGGPAQGTATIPSYVSSYQ